MVNTGLGKGLSALISENDIDGSNSGGYLPNVPVEKIAPNRFQPRSKIQKESLEELAESIKEHGVIEPLIVTKTKKGGYELIAGERRLEAAKLAKLKTIPAVVKEASPQQMLELAVVENIQRADLNPLEEGLAFEQLAKEFGLNHDQISKKVGLSRPAVANKIRLLKLPDVVKEGLLNNDIDEGHARALLGLTNEGSMIQTYKIILRDKLSVRAVEELVRRLNQGHKPVRRKNQIIVDEKTTSLENSLKEKFSKKVKLTRSKKGGKIVIPFKNDEELNKYYSMIMGNIE